MSDSVEKMDSTEQQPTPATNNDNGSSENMADAVVEEPIKKELDPNEAVSAIEEPITEKIMADTNGGEVEVQEEQSETKEEMLKEEKMDASSVKSDQQQLDDKNYEELDAYKMFMTKNLNRAVASNLIRMFEALNLTTEEFDDRAVEMLATFPVDQANFVVQELRNSRLYGVQNKPQYLMSVMRNFRERLRSMGFQQAMELPLIPGPDPDAIKTIINRTGYQLEVTVGQRKYHSPPDYDGPDPNQGGESGCVYIGQIPKDVYEESLIPLFETVGQIYDLRIMMDPVMGKSRGYGFLIYCDKNCAHEAAKKFDGHEILPAKPLKVNVSVANTRLFLGNIPKSKSKEEILEELRKHTENALEVIIYSNPDAHDGRKNRGFCFVDFTDHKAASDAKRRISMGKIRPWNTDLVVDWAEQQDEPDEEIMSHVKVLYVRNLKEAVNDQRLKEIFGVHGEIEKVKRIKDYAFIHFKERESAVKAMEALNKTEIDGVEIEISLAKPQGDQMQKKKLAMKRFPGSAQQQYGSGTPGLGGSGGSRGGRGGGGYGPSGRGGRGGAGPNQRGGMGAYYPPAYPQGGYPPPSGPYAPPYDPYAAYGYGAGYGPGYDMYGAAAYPPGAVDPYYAAPAVPPYGAGPPMRGGAGGGYGGGGGYPGGTVARGRGGKPTGSGGGGGRGGKRGGRGGAGKRSGGDFGGPASKRGGRAEDFASDPPMNMF